MVPLWNPVSCWCLCLGTRYKIEISSILSLLGKEWRHSLSTITDQSFHHENSSSRRIFENRGTSWEYTSSSQRYDKRGQHGILTVWRRVNHSWNIRMEQCSLIFLYFSKANWYRWVPWNLFCFFCFYFYKQLCRNKGHSKVLEIDFFIWKTKHSFLF